MATSQFIPELRIGYLYTYWGPLVSFKENSEVIFISFLLEKNGVG